MNKEKNTSDIEICKQLIRKFIDEECEGDIIRELNYFHQMQN